MKSTKNEIIIIGNSTEEAEYPRLHQTRGDIRAS